MKDLMIRQSKNPNISKASIVEINTNEHNIPLNNKFYLLANINDTCFSLGPTPSMGQKAEVVERHQQKIVVSKGRAFRA